MIKKYKRNKYECWQCSGEFRSRYMIRGRKVSSGGGLGGHWKGVCPICSKYSFFRNVPNFKMEYKLIDRVPRIIIARRKEDYFATKRMDS